MSEKRSWDIQPKRKAAPPAPPQQPVRQTRTAPPLQRREAPREMRRASSAPSARVPRRQVLPPRPKLHALSEPRNRSVASLRAIRVVRPVPPSVPLPQGRSREPLKTRRKRARQRSMSIFFIVLVLVIGGAFGSLWLPAVRIQSIQAGGPDADGMQNVTEGVLQGTYHYIVPRDSIFFFPEDAIRSQILSEYPDISAVSISRVSFNTIAVISIPREAAFTWCGANYNPPQPSKPTTLATASSTSPTANQQTCYSADAQGIIFAQLSSEVASSSDMLQLYGPLAGNTDSSASPLGQTIGQANLIPNALQFVKAIKSLGVPIVSLVLRGDEADLYAQSGTRITYVLGHEEISAQLAAAAFPSLNLNDGSLEYVDLRFEGKVYFKKYGDTATTEATSTSTH